MLPRQSSHSAAIGPGVTGGPLAHPIPTSAEHQHQRHAPLAPSSGNEAFVVDPSAMPAEGDIRKHTQYPYVTGTSVLGITYKDGVLIACDTLGAYGSTKRYKSFDRVYKVNDSCIVAAGGELSDFQYIMMLLEELADDDFCMDDGHHLKPAEVFAYLSRVIYNRRNKMDPLWNSVVVGGVHAGKPFLGTVGMIGTNYQDVNVATGFGNQLARPLMRERHSPDMEEADAVALMHDCLRVCYYRDKNSINKFQLSKVTKDGVNIGEPFALETKWDYKLFANPSANAVGTCSLDFNKIFSISNDIDSLHILCACCQMVLKKDPRALLDLLHKPVDIDEDEFLDKIDKNKSFHSMPDKPTAKLTVGAVMNDEEEKMLSGIADVDVEEEDLITSVPATDAGPVELTEKQQRFYSFFHGVGAKEDHQAAVPDTVHLNTVEAALKAAALPRVGDTQEEKEAKEEDLARRMAALEAMAKNERKPSDLYEKTHARYVATFGDVRQKN